MLGKAADYVARDVKSVKLGISPLVSDDYVSTLLSRLNSADSELNIVISQMNKSDIEPAMQSGSIDFGVGPGPMGFEKSKALRIYSEPLLYLTDGDSNSKRGAVTLSDLNGKTILFVQDDCGLASVKHELFSEFKIDVLEYEGRALSYNVLETWVKLGLGTTLLPASKVADISIANRINNNDGDSISVEFQACWLISQEDRKCFDIVKGSKLLLSTQYTTRVQ